MTNKLQTAQDFKDEYNDLERRKDRMDNYLTNLLIRRCKAHPEAVIDMKSNTEIKAKAISNLNVGHLPFHRRLEYLEKIEIHVKENEAKQLDLPFN